MTGTSYTRASKGRGGRQSVSLLESSQDLSVRPSRSFPATGLDRPLGYQKVEAPEVLDNRHRKVARLSALCTGRLYPQEGFLGPRATMRPEGLSH
jgi:hypothetical protein